MVGWVGKVDMGQGTDIGWIKLIAEELDLPTDRVSMVQGHTDKTVDQGGASGSTGVWRAGAALRNAAAEARYALLGMASEKLAVPIDRLTVIDGVISDKSDPAKKVSYGELIGGRHFDVQLDWNKHYRQRAPGQGQGEAQIAERVQDRRQARHAAARHRAESARQDRIHGGREGARHAARAHDPPAGRRRGAGRGR